MLKNKLRKKKKVRIKDGAVGMTEARQTQTCWLLRRIRSKVTSCISSSRKSELRCGFDTAMPVDGASRLWLQRHQWYQGSTQIKASIARLHLATQ